MWFRSIIVFLEKHLDTIIALLTVAAAVFSVILNFCNDEDNDVFVIALLIIIAVNLISMVHRYLRRHSSQLENLTLQSSKLTDIKSDIDGIKDRLEHIRPQSSSFVELRTRRKSKSIADIIKEAKHELFISGINLHTLSGFDKEILLCAQEGVRIRILVFDVYDKALLETFEKMVGHEIKGPRSTYIFLRHFLDCENIEIKQADFIMPAMFMAYDMDKDYGYIKAKHYLNEKYNRELPNIELTPDKDWYGNYRSNIKDLWKKGKPYEPKEEDR